jgi:CheY-like chemotaxis protein
MPRITVVDDYAPFLELLDTMLTDAGHAVRQLDGQQASVDEIAATEPDLLIIDVLVQGQSALGWDVIALARAHEKLRDVPIIVSTADVQQEEARREELARISDLHVLDKPFTPDELMAAIDRAMRDGRRPISSS